MMTEDERKEMDEELESVIKLFRRGADACAEVSVMSGTAYISVNDISAIVESGDGVEIHQAEIHMKSGTIFTMTEPPEKSHSRSQPRVTIDEWGKEGPCVTVYTEDGCEYVGMLRLWKDAQGNEVEE
jgi:hypothetical protein